MDNRHEMLADNIAIKVETRFMPDSLPAEQDKYAFAYRITITNNNDEAVTLRNRYWLITDGNGQKTEVQGPGVVGKEPCISSQNTYQYTSGAVLETPVGTMEGYYEMEDKTGARFKVPIDVFRLCVPNLVN